MALWPVRGRKAPDFWDDDLKAYVDDGNPAIPGSAAASQVDARILDLAQSAIPRYESVAAAEAGLAADEFADGDIILVTGA